MFSYGTTVKMDKFYRGKNTRPKRRKYADFPYTIFTVEAENAEPQFYVRFVDGEGEDHCIALGMELYRAMNQLELDVKRLHNEEERHFARGVQFPEAICASGDQVANWVEGKLMQEALHKAITMLPDTQRRRLELYYFAGLTYEQIAALEGCSYPAVIKSVKKAIVELRRYLM